MLPAIGLALGAMVGNIIAQDSANRTNIQMAEGQMDFQERMSNTAYQRAVADMRAAGINPMLAIDKGGASTPSGAMANVQPLDFTDKILPAVSTALDLKQKEAATGKIKSDTELNKSVEQLQAAQAHNTVQQSRINSANAVKAEAEAKFYRENPWAIPLQQGLNMGGSAAGIATGVGKVIDALKSKTTKGWRIP